MDRRRENNVHDNTINTDRVADIHRSNGAKIGWKRHHSSHMQGIRKRDRQNMNQSFYSISKQLEETLQTIDEAKISKDNVFDLKGQILFDTLSGGVSFEINAETGNVSVSAALQEHGNGNYRVENAVRSADTYKTLYTELRDELASLVDNFDAEFKQVLARHGLRETS